jgi:hypothetical protein
LKMEIVAIIIKVNLQIFFNFFFICLILVYFFSFFGVK